MPEQAVHEFREDEVAVLRHWDKKRNEWITNIFPKLGGRLRLGHAQNEHISIETEIYKYDGTIAVVIAKTRTDKGVFFGIGMSSLERDEKIAPAILEMAESRAIARSLRFAGYGAEYCGAEEIANLENGNGDKASDQRQAKPENQQSGGNGKNHSQKPDNGNGKPAGPETRKAHVEIGFEPVEGCPDVGKPHFRIVENDMNPPEPGNGNGNNGNGPVQMSPAQWGYIRDLGRQRGWNLARLSEKAIEMFGIELASLSKKDASTFLNHLMTGN
jgi:hypothetical protein